MKSFLSQKTENDYIDSLCLFIFHKIFSTEDCANVNITYLKTKQRTISLTNNITLDNPNPH